jgi:hypothetical protein
VLVTVGAGDALVGAGVGGELGGARVGEGRGVEGCGAGCVVGCPAVGCPAVGCPAVGCPADDCPAAGAPAWVACPAADRALAGPLARRGFAWCVAEAEAWADAAVAPGVGVVTVWLPAVCAGTFRANTIAKPTVASAPSWVVRQVSRPSRRRPVSRACAG